MPDKIYNYVLSTFGTVYNFYLTMVIAITGSASRLDSVEQWGRIITNGLLGVSTVFIIILNWDKVVTKVKGWIK